jgi:Icc-related predicted phosphoesterase
MLNPKGSLYVQTPTLAKDDIFEGASERDGITTSLNSMKMNFYISKVTCEETNIVLFVNSTPLQSMNHYEANIILTMKSNCYCEMTSIYKKNLLVTHVRTMPLHTFPE